MNANKFKKCFIRVVKAAISFFVAFLDSIVLYIFKIAGKPYPYRCTVLYYHDLPRYLTDRFSAQMRHLKRITIPFRIDQPPSFQNNRLYCAITFDDGYKSVRDNACPVLSEFNIPATIFVVTGSLGVPPNWLKRPGLRFKNDYVMDREEIHDLSLNPLISIGSHTVSHRKLSELTKTEIVEELAASKECLESIINKPVKSISYPHGDYSQQVLLLTRQAGYRNAYLIVPGISFKRPDEFAINRIPVDPEESLFEFSLKIRGAYRWLAAGAKSKSTYL